MLCYERIGILSRVAKAGRSSALPVLPNTTQTFRKNRGRLIRLSVTSQIACGTSHPSALESRGFIATPPPAHESALLESFANDSTDKPPTFVHTHRAGCQSPRGTPLGSAPCAHGQIEMQRGIHPMWRSDSLRRTGIDAPRALPAMIAEGRIRRQLQRLGARPGRTMCQAPGESAPSTSRSTPAPRHSHGPAPAPAPYDIISLRPAQGLHALIHALQHLQDDVVVVIAPSIARDPITRIRITTRVVVRASVTTARHRAAPPRIAATLRRPFHPGHVPWQRPQSTLGRSPHAPPPPPSRCGSHQSRPRGEGFDGCDSRVHGASMHRSPPAPSVAAAFPMAESRQTR